MKKIVVKRYAVGKENGGFAEFVIIKDGDKFLGINYKDIDENGCSKRQLRGHDCNISHSLEECLERCRKSVRLAEIMERHGCTEFEADQIDRFGEIRVTHSELMEMSKTNDFSKLALIA